MVTSLVSIPIKEKVKDFIAEVTSIENFPSISVLTPEEVPFKITVTPGKGFPCSSFTTPFTVFDFS